MMEPSKTDPNEEFHGLDSSMISSTSPYQPTTEPVPDRRPFVGGFILDMHYIKSHPGILKIAEILLDIIVAICVGSTGPCAPRSCSAIAYLQFVCISAMVVTTFFFIIYLFSLQQKIEIINWPLSDLLNSAVTCVLYLIASIVMAANATSSAGKAACAFGFFVTVLYGLSAWKAYGLFIIQWRKRKSPVSHIQQDENNETQELA